MLVLTSSLKVTISKTKFHNITNGHIQRITVRVLIKWVLYHEMPEFYFFQYQDIFIN